MTWVEQVWAEKTQIERTGAGMAWAEWVWTESIQLERAGAEWVLFEWVWVERAQDGRVWAGGACPGMAWADWIGTESWVQICCGTQDGIPFGKLDLMAHLVSLA